MTLFDDDRYSWRETYFVFFESALRPKLPKVRRALKMHAPFLVTLDSKANEYGHLEAITIASYEDHAALEICYREGGDVLAEAKNFFLTLKNEANTLEHSRLEQIAGCCARLDVHHFEQKAGTEVFNVFKVPELVFPLRGPDPVAPTDVFSRALGLDKGKFYFDPHSYERCRTGQTTDEQTATDIEERIDPEMLVTVLEILCRLSHGIAIDPASGIILE